tara:strand:+ start:1629 stop:1799 length:171 start_codon:yes stop_codon:yes gene_type:complete
MFIAEREIAQARFDICKSCEYFIKEGSRCSKCGCFMKLKCKAKMAHCPVNKWGPIK